MALRTPSHIVLATGLAISILAGCTSRTLPLPPPVVGRVSAISDGQVEVTGFALSGAAVGVFNEDNEAGVIVSATTDGCEDNCPFRAVLEGLPGDTLRIWQFFETSEASFHTVRSR